MTNQATLNQLQFLKASMLRWAKIAIPAGIVLSSAIVAVLILLLPSVYQSTAILRVRNRTPYIAFPQPTTGRDPFVSTQLGLLRTRSVLEPAVESLLEQFDELPGGKDNSGWLRESLKTRVSAELVHLSFGAGEPKLSKEALDAILNSYLAYSQSFQSGTSDRVIELLSQERENRQAVVNAAKEKIRREVEQSGTVLADTNLTESVVEGSFTAMERLLINTEVEIEVLKARLTSEQERIATGEVERATDQQLEDFVASSPEVTSVRNIISSKKSRLDDYLVRLKDPENTPLVRETRDQIASLEAELKETSARLRSQAKKNFTEVSQAAVLDGLENIESQLAAKGSIRDRLVERLQKQAARINNEVIDVEFARADLARQEDIFDKISARIVALQTERAAPDRVEVIDRPQLPKKPLSRDWKKLLLGGLFGFVLPFLPCLLYERLAERISTADSIEAGSGIEVVGETALLPRYLEQTSSVERLRPFRDSVSCVVSILQLSNHSAGSKVVGILSSVSGEGKTSFATQLAISLAQGTQAPVLLLEVDLRAPDIRHLLGLEKVPGLSEVLLKEKELCDVVQEDVIPNLSCRLDVLTAGLRSDRALPLEQKAMASILEEMKTQYSYIVVDTSPILSTNESLSIALLSDINLLCTMQGYSRMRQVRTSLSRLNRIEVIPDGIVLNGVDHTSYYSRYGRYDTQVESV